MPANLARGSAATAGGRGYRGISRLDECPVMLEGGGTRAVCDAFHICHSCVTVPDCEWHMDPKIAKCQKMKVKKHLQSHLQSAVVPIKKIIGSNKNIIKENINIRKVNKTTEMKDARKDNQDIGSNSDPDDNKPQPPLVGNSETETGLTEVIADDLHPPVYEYESRIGLPTGMRGHSDSPCDSACSDRTSCSECLQQSCMWCKNLRMCTDRNAYLASFPYGQCMDWTTVHGSCPTTLVPKRNGKFFLNM